MKRLPSGFTLVETLVAISILLVAIVGPFYAIQRSITAAYLSRDQLTATALSQEGIEYIYALRDNNFLQNQQLGANYGWLDGLNGNANGTGDSANCILTTNPNGCTLDPTQTVALAACASTVCLPLTLETSSGRYTQVTTNPATKFTRKIEVTVISSVEIRVKVTVTWKTLATPNTLVTTEELYNWL